MGIRSEPSYSSPENITEERSKAIIPGPDIFADNQLAGFAMLRKYSEEGRFLSEYAIDKCLQNKNIWTKNTGGIDQTASERNRI